MKNPEESPPPAPSERFYTRQGEGESDEELVERLVQWDIAARNAWRARHGLPPVPKE